MKYLIIGNSAAATGAIEAIRQHDNDGSITVLSNESYPLYSRCLLSYYLAQSIPESGLRIRPDDWHRKNNVEVLTGKQAVEVILNSQKVRCEDGSVYDYDRLLIAAGGTPKVPDNIPGDIDGVCVLRNIEDARLIETTVRKDGKAVILGGGLVGMKAAFALKTRGLEVTVVLRSPNVLSQMIDYDAAQIVMKRLKEYGIDIATGADVSEIMSEHEKLTAVKITTGESERIVPCDLLIAAKGVTPNTELIENSGIEKDWGIITDQYMQTNVEHIYAAGDVAETLDMATGERTVNALWTCAVEQGKIAGHNMAGQKREYNGSLGMNSINFPGIDLISFGVVRPKDDSGYEILVEKRTEQGIYKKIVLQDNIVKGLILVNKIDNAGLLLSLLGRQIDVSSFKEDLLNDNFNYARILSVLGGNELERYWHAGHTTRN